MHATRMLRYGDVNRGRQKKPTEDRFWAKVDKTDTCWLWRGAIKDGGYGNFLADKHTLAHRFAYTLLVGPIPAGLTLDHLCRVRRCVNPRHLEPVSNAENVRRGIHPRKTHCLRGHLYSEANTWRDKDGHRFCRQCMAARNAKRQRRRPSQ